MENVIEKLQKLLAHERSARTIGNVHEAEAFAAKIADLLFAHKLSMSEVEIEQEERDEPVNQESVDGFRAPWAGVLAMGVCEASFCRVLQSHNGYVFIGRLSDRTAAIAMYRYLAAMGKTLCDGELVRYMRSEEYIYDSSFRPGVARTWRVSFLRGYANALHNRLKIERRSLTANAQSSGTSLVYVNKSEAAVDDYVKQTFEKLRNGSSSSSRVHNGAYAAGRTAGSSVALKSQAALGCGR